MAKGCVSYVIETYVHPIGWESTGSRFRDTPENAIKRFEAVVKSWPGGAASMLRLAEVKVLAQTNIEARELVEG
jgi:hypothetical protein